MSHTVDQALRAARAAMKARDGGTARAVLLAALSRFSRNPRLLASLAEVQAALSGLPVRPFSEAHLRRVLAIKSAHGVAAAHEDARALVLLFPSHPAVQNLRGGLLLEAREPQAATEYFETALRLAPDFVQAATNLAEAHFQHGSALLVAGKPGAEAAFVAALARNPSHHRARTNLGNILLARGESGLAAAEFAKAIEANPLSALAHYNLGRVHKYSPGDPLIEAMSVLTARADLPPSERMPLEFALGKALEDVGQIDASFAHYRAANDLRRQQLRYETARDVNLFAHIRAHHRAAELPVLGDLEPALRRPVFVLGMMRSGTTLVEQILSSHPLAYGAGELNTLNDLVKDLLPADAVPGRDALLALRREYLDRIAALPGTEPVVVDKMPSNFRWIGLIRHVLPEARILPLRRDPVAVCWSIYKTLFTSTEHGYDCTLPEIAAYHDLYSGLMTFWDADGAARMDIDYQALTGAPEPMIRAMLDYVGLPFDAACLAPQDNPRTARTASMQQVKQGIYSGSSQGWRRFAQHLGPLTSHFPQSV